MKQIHTREQLEKEIKRIVWSHNYDDLDYEECAREICDLIADLGNHCFHSKVDSSSSSST